MSLLTDFTLIGKRNFLICYSKARKEAIIAKNIKSGWRAGGLWPVNSAKPLLSRLLLENSNKLENQASKRKAEDLLLDWNEMQLDFVIFTPKKLNNVREDINQVSQLRKAFIPIAKVLFRKVSKA